MYQFVTGPLAWIAFTIFFVGLLVRVIGYIRGLDWQADRVAYTQHLSYGMRGALRSILYWLLPFGTRSWRFYPVFTLMFFIFHISLLVVPIFLPAHNILLKERWGFGLWTLSEPVADIMTLAMFGAAIFLILRRIALPEVRILTTPYDYLVLAITLAPFITGFLASHLVGDYQFWLIAHIITGEVLLIAIPFTKLSHFALFFMSRAQLGMDYGIKRGGMKSKGLAW